LLPLLALIVFRLGYYGALLPNTFAAKPSTLLSYPLGAWRYLVDSAMSLGALALGVVAVIAFTWFTRPPQRPLLSALLLPFSAVLAFALYTGGDWMPHARFLLPALPCLFLAAVLLLPGRRWLPLSVGGLALVLFEGHGALDFFNQLDANSEHDHALRSQNNVAMGSWLAHNARPGASILCDEIGAIAFHSRLRVLDMWGLVDRDVAALLHERGFNPYNSPTGTDARREALEVIAKALLARQPDYIVIDYRATVPRVPQEIDPRFFLPFTMRGLSRNMGDEYRFVHAFPLMTDPPKTFLLFERGP
jgi:hypothetical protein